MLVNEQRAVNVSRETYRPLILYTTTNHIIAL